jgi:Domain of unknown function (DUF3597)
LSHDEQEEEMSIFGKIKDAIFGSPKGEQAAPASSPGPISSAASAAPLPNAAAAAPGVAGATSMSQVDVEAVLTQRAAQTQRPVKFYGPATA